MQTILNNFGTKFIFLKKTCTIETTYGNSSERGEKGEKNSILDFIKII